MVLEEKLQSPLDSMEIKPVSPKGNQPWILTGRTDAETLVLWPPDAMSRLIGKDRRQTNKEALRMRKVESNTNSKEIYLSKF